MCFTFWLPRLSSVSAQGHLHSCYQWAHTPPSHCDLLPPWDSAPTNQEGIKGYPRGDPCCLHHLPGGHHCYMPIWGYDLQTSVLTSSSLLQCYGPTLELLRTDQWPIFFPYPFSWLSFFLHFLQSSLCSFSLIKLSCNCKTYFGFLKAVSLIKSLSCKVIK